MLRRIELKCDRLKRLSLSMERKPGKPSRGSIKPSEIKRAVLEILTDCHEYGVPPPKSLVALISSELIGSSNADRQDKVDATEEELIGGASFEVTGHQVEPIYRAKLSAVAAAAGRDERTIRRWRNDDDEYVKMVIVAITERQLLKHSDKIKE